MDYQFYWTKLMEIAKELEDIGSDNFNRVEITRLKPILDRLEEVAHDKSVPNEIVERLLEDKDLEDALVIIRDFYVNIGARLERENAYDILETRDPWSKLDEFHFFERYEGLLKNESELTKFDEKTTMVFIGSGPLPLTIIMFQKMFNCNCIGIEVQGDVAEISRRVIRKLGLEDKIKIVIGDERCLKEIDYDVVMVAAFAIPKDKVFANVWEIVDSYTPILYRTYSGMRQLLYQPVTKKDLRGFHEVDRRLPIGNVNNTSVLIQKIV